MARVQRRRIVVGDVHGELDGLTEILRHAGVIDANEDWVDGATVLIQTGDVIDRGRDSRAAISLLRRLQKQAAVSSGSVVRCCGNHELCLLQACYDLTDVSDPDRLADELRDEVALGLLRAAYSDGARLYTHAGLRSIVRQTLLHESQGSGKATGRLNNLANRINAVFRDAVKQNRCGSENHCIFWVGPERGGDDRVGGIFWCDYRTILPSERAWDVPQVFGHTPALEPTLRHAHSLKLINVDAGMCEVYGGHRVYLEITADGALRQHSKNGNGWEAILLAES